MSPTPIAGASHGSHEQEDPTQNSGTSRALAWRRDRGAGLGGRFQADSEGGATGHKASLPQGSVFAINLCRGNSAPRSVCLAPSHCSSSSIFTEAPLVCTVSPCFHFFIALITLKTQKNLSCSFPCSSLAFFHLSALSGPETLYIFFITIFRA